MVRGRLRSRTAPPGVGRGAHRRRWIQAFNSIRSEHQLIDRADFDLLFRWFVGLGLDDRVWDTSSFSKNRDQFLALDASAAFLSDVIGLRSKTEAYSAVC